MVAAVRHIVQRRDMWLPVRENEISLHKWSGGSAHLRILQGPLRIYTACSPFKARSTLLWLCLRGCTIAFALKQTFAQYKFS